MPTKSQQLQIRVSPQEKRAIRRRAKAAGQDLSTYVLSRALPARGGDFARALQGLADLDERCFCLASATKEIYDLAPPDLEEAVEGASLRDLSPYLQNYVAAMVEHAAHLKGVRPPRWVRDVEPLEEPHFASSLTSLRAHLLRSAPVAFKRRNIFVDSTVGDRV